MRETALAERQAGLDRYQFGFRLYDRRKQREASAPITCIDAADS